MRAGMMISSNKRIWAKKESLSQWSLPSLQRCLLYPSCELLWQILAIFQSTKSGTWARIRLMAKSLFQWWTLSKTLSARKTKEIVMSNSPTSWLRSRLESQRKLSMKISSIWTLPLARSTDPIAPLSKLVLAASPDLTSHQWCALHLQWSARDTVVCASVSGATRQSLIGAITARSVTDAFSRWTITAPGSQTASDSTTISSSWICFSTALALACLSCWLRTASSHAH